MLLGINFIFSEFLKKSYHLTADCFFHIAHLKLWNSNLSFIVVLSYLED